MFDYEQLRLIWWGLIGVLMIGFTITDGFDMGVGALLRIIGKNDSERRVMINTIAPHWDGNQVWLVTLGGALFAAWPFVYATAFSGFYAPMMIILMALFLRPVGFDYRSKLENVTWRNTWDWCLVIGSAVPPIIFGVAFGNLIQGVPFEFDAFLRPTYTGNFLNLLNPFALLAGVLSLTMILTQGTAWLMLKTDGKIYTRARNIGFLTAITTFILFSLAGLWIANGIEGFVLNHFQGTMAASNPTKKTVIRQTAAWMLNYKLYPWMQYAPALGLSMSLLSAACIFFKRHALAFLCSSLTIVGIILTAGFSMFPFVMPSSLNPNHSLTLWDATSSMGTLKIMLFAATLFVPIILSYTLWIYFKMFGRVTEKYIEQNKHSLY